ncbi:MAG: hypothetical protein LBM93_01900 [Oscillospiraceae bacterium]|jgi:hypothetical protein|nr:hypothetical protein [Oscillospiraceae bacterium]
MKKLTLIPLVLLLLATTACSGTKETGSQTAAKGDIQTGTWSEDGTVFTNEWSGIKFTLPDGYVAASEEELAEMSGASQETVAEGSNDLAASVDMARTAYDFVVQPSDGTGLPYMMLVYEDRGLSVAMNSIDENGYIDDVILTELKAAEAQGMVFSEIERTTATVAGAKWTCGKYSINDGAGFQEYYLRKVGSVMYGLSITYYQDTADAAATLLSAITAIE